MAEATYETGKSYTLDGFFDPRRIHPLRSMILFALGTIAGLAIAGYGLFTAEGTVTHRVPPENVALVNNRPILRTDFIAQTETQFGVPFGEASREQRLKVLDDMIREELFVQRGLELDFPGTDPDTRTALVAAVLQQVVAEVTVRPPSEAELRQFYEEHKAAYSSEGTMTLHNFLVRGDKAAAADLAQKAVTALKAGATPAQLQAMGVEELIPEHASPEQFYFAQKAHIGDELFARAARLESGDISEPVALPDGLHILQMVKNTHPTPASFDKARSQVLSDFLGEARKRVEEADLRYLRGKADILVADDYAEEYEAAQSEAK